MGGIDQCNIQTDFLLENVPNGIIAVFCLAHPRRPLLTLDSDYKSLYIPEPGVPHHQNPCIIPILTQARILHWRLEQRAHLICTQAIQQHVQLWEGKRAASYSVCVSLGAQGTRHTNYISPVSDLDHMQSLPKLLHMRRKGKTGESVDLLQKPGASQFLQTPRFPD